MSALSPDFLEDAAGFYHSAAAIDTTLHVGARCPAKGSGCVRRSDVYTSDVYSDSPVSIKLRDLVAATGEPTPTGSARIATLKRRAKASLPSAAVMVADGVTFTSWVLLSCGRLG